MTDSSTVLLLTRSTVLYAGCAAINSMNLGYDIGISTQVGRLLQQQEDWTDFQRELFVASLNFWAMGGAALAQSISDRYGRKRTFAVAALGFIAGILIMVAVPESFNQNSSLGVLLLGRGLVGLAVGVGLAIDPLYIAEISPPNRRGELVTWAEIALNIGIVLGFSTGLFFGNLQDHLEWRIMLALGTILPIVMLLLLYYVMPESPRWLIVQNRQQEAQVVLEQIVYPPSEIQNVLDSVKLAIQREREAEQAVGWTEIFHPTPAIQRMLLVGIGTAVAQQLVGIDAIQYYLLDVLDQSSIDSDEKKNLVLILLGLFKLAFIVVGGKLFDRMGRKPLFVISLVGMAGSLFLVSLSYFIQIDGTVFTVLGLAMYLSFFSIGMGPGAWLVPAEVFSIAIRAKAMSLATFLNRFTATIMSASFLSIKNLLGWGGFFLLLSFISIFTLFFLQRFLPETKGKSLEEMTLYFAQVTSDHQIMDAENLLATNGFHASEMLEQQRKPVEDESKIV